MIVFLRSTDGNPDSRLQKYTDVLVQKQIRFTVLAWDRLNKFSDTDTFSYYKKKALYGAGIGNVRNILGFNVFLLCQLIKTRKKYKIIHACDFDTVVPALFMKFFFRKKLIYDIFDWYIDSRGITGGFVKVLVLMCEYIALKFSDVTIICEEERCEQLCCTPRCIWVLPNIPHFDYSGGFMSNHSSRMRLAYVGVLGTHRGLEKILEYVGEHVGKMELTIAGFGELESLVQKESEKHSNIYFLGSISYKQSLEVMRKADIICAIYETTIPNHIYAAPNKYYEGLFLNKPILTTKGTLVGIKTEKYKTGFVIGEEVADLDNCFSDLLIKDKIKEYGYNAAFLWNKAYVDYVDRFMTDYYLPFLKKEY